MDGNTTGLERRKGRRQMGRATISNHVVMEALTEMGTFQLKNLRVEEGSQRILELCFPVE